MPLPDTTPPIPSSTLTNPPSARRSVAVIGGGPAGLMAAEVLSRNGVHVDVFDAMPSVGRKFLLAGKGGLNLTHSEPFDAFAGRFGERSSVITPWLRSFGPDQLRAWAQGLGVQTFIGSSGRVFPIDLKAAPLLRAWLARLRASGVAFHMRHRWIGFDDAAVAANGRPAALRFITPRGEVGWTADAVVLALGGASWPQLGSDGAWVPGLAARGVAVAPLRASNCGFDMARETELEADRDSATRKRTPGWSEFFSSRFAGQPLKTVAMSLQTASGIGAARRGEFVVTGTGVEGSLVYAISAAARDEIDARGRARVLIDLLPDRTSAFVHDELTRPRGSRSLSTHLKTRLHIDGVKAALLHELLPREVLADLDRLAAALKALPLTLVAARPVAEAISTAGGVRFDAFRADGMLESMTHVACAGEMLDWEAPTGGYLLTACMASGMQAGQSALTFLSHA